MNNSNAEFKNLVFRVPGKAELSARGLWVAERRVVIQGPSGCGKSTFLKVLAGLRPPSSGEWFLGDREMTHLPPHLRRCGFVFQSGALFDHLSVLENLCFGLKNFFPLDSDEVGKNKARKFLNRVGLDGFEDRDCLHLSGGERQRVALARTLLCEPQYLLLDEPLSAVDVEHRKSLNELILSLLEERPIPTILVTHDPHEARFFGQQILEWKEDGLCLDF